MQSKLVNKKLAHDLGLLKKESKVMAQYISSLMKCFGSLIKSLEFTNSLMELENSLKQVNTIITETKNLSSSRFESLWSTTEESFEMLLTDTSEFKADKIIITLKKLKREIDVPILEGKVHKEEYYQSCAYCKKETESINGLKLFCNHFIDRWCLIK